jgi:nitrogen regulatory protein P-II 2
LDLLIKTISDIARSGQKGDGKIFVTDIEKVVRIRTGETDHDAL